MSPFGLTKYTLGFCLGLVLTWTLETTAADGFADVARGGMIGCLDEREELVVDCKAAGATDGFSVAVVGAAVFALAATGILP